MQTGAHPDRPIPEPAGVLTAREAETRLTEHIQQVRGSASGQPVDFSGLDLRLAGSLAGRALTALRAPRACLAGLDLSGCELQGARLAGADLRGCKLAGADLRGADLSGAWLTHADLTGARLTPLTLGGGRVLPVQLDKAQCRYSDWRGADLDQARLAGTDLAYARMSGARLSPDALAGALGTDRLLDR
jgi:uncharacterized protein YjbI with pentapeptide repeats